MSEQTQLTIREWIKSDSLQSQIKQALPNASELGRFMRAFYTSVQKVPKLMQCSRESLFSCVIQCAQVGIQPDGRRAHLIPYGNQATLIIDYKGLVELVYRSGDVRSIHSDVVCDNDDFELDMGLVTRHKIDLKQPRGEPYAAYSLVRMANGGVQCVVMHRDEIEAIRKKSKAGNSGPWVDFPMEMWKKTAFRRLCKWLPLTPEIKAGIEADDEHMDDMRNVTQDVPSLPGQDEEGGEQ